ncbi:MAG: helix-turn-helix transcriptional regulator [Clostridiales bacterium]|nr:helix-turn-helix transcriptional regulator [Clostridiales bacterium]
MEYTKEIKKAMNYIENNLKKEIRTEDIADSAGFSKYHFQRVFKRETGLNLYAYIQKRRLAEASSLLRNTNVRILDIAVYLCFESQEAFTRAFKKVYGLPPGQYRKVLKNLTNGGMNMKKNTEIKHWLITGTAPDKYKTGIDRTVFHTGTASAFIQSEEEEFVPDEYATIMQQFRAERFLGKRVRFSAFVKALEVEGWAGLWLRLDGKFSVTLKLDNMQNRPIKGTINWNLYSCVLDVPEETELINIGILLNGKGRVWLDDVSFQEVDRTVPVTDFEIQKEYPDYPENLTFEE